jgi:hypothetical protein
MSMGWALLASGLTCLAVASAAGGPEERLFAAAQALSGLFELLFARNGDIDVAVLIDVGVLAVIVPVALRTQKVWPLIAASFSVAAMMTEAAQHMVRASPQAYGLLQGVWDLLADIVVAIGGLCVWRARRRAGAGAHILS